MVPRALGSVHVPPHSKVFYIQKLLSDTLFISILNMAPVPSLGTKEGSSVGSILLDYDSAGLQCNSVGVVGDDQWRKYNQNCSFVLYFKICSN